MDTAQPYRLSIVTGSVVLLILGILLLGWQRVEAADCLETRAAACDPVETVGRVVPQA
jgi:hypothetical protein